VTGIASNSTRVESWLMRRVYSDASPRFQPTIRIS
jgi:hypothetical protein